AAPAAVRCMRVVVLDWAVVLCRLRLRRALLCFFFFFNDPAPTEIYTLSLHDALPIWTGIRQPAGWTACASPGAATARHRRARGRSEEHTSELQSRFDLVCRLLLEKKKKKKIPHQPTNIHHNDCILIS